MGYASLVEDIIERFDDAESSTAPYLRCSKPPPPKAVAERERLEREKHATAIAIREFQKNQRKAEEQQATITCLKQQIAQADGELRKLKAKASNAAKANKTLIKDLAKYRVKYAHRADQQLRTNVQPSEASLFSILMKIENFNEKDLAILDKESRKRFSSMRAYASSQRRIEAQATEIGALKTSLTNISREVQTLGNFLENIDRENRSLDEESKTFQRWDVMTDWLHKNPSFAPREHAASQLPLKANKPETPFNPVFRGDADC